MHVLVLTMNDVASPKYGGALRVASLIEQLRRRDINVSVIRFRSANEFPSVSTFPYPIFDILVPPMYPWSPLAALIHWFSFRAEHYAKLINQRNHIDLIQSDSPWGSLTGTRFAKKFKVPHIVLSHNCETKLGGQISHGGLARKIPIVGNWIADFNLRILQWAEKKVISEAELTLTPSIQDVEDMVSFSIPIQHVKILPNGTNIQTLDKSKCKEIKNNLGIPGDVPVTIFFGRLDYPPNREAVVFVVNYIAPRCPGVIFLIVGMNPPQLKVPENVRLTGYVDQLEPYLCACDLAVIPITFGSGTRIKILDSWAAGIPILSTTMAASGLEYKNGVNILIEDNLYDFPSRILKLLGSRARLSMISEEGLNAVKPYLWDVIGQDYVNEIYGLIKGSN